MLIIHSNGIRLASLAKEYFFSLFGPFGAKMAKKWPKNGQKMAKKWPKNTRILLKITQNQVFCANLCPEPVQIACSSLRSPTSDFFVAFWPLRAQNGPNSAPQWPKNGPKMGQKWRIFVEIDSKSCVFGQFRPLNRPNPV